MNRYESETRSRKATAIARWLVDEGWCDRPSEVAALATAPDCEPGRLIAAELAGVLPASTECWAQVPGRVAFLAKLRAKATDPFPGLGPNPGVRR